MQRIIKFLKKRESGDHQFVSAALLTWIMIILLLGITFFVSSWMQRFMVADNVDLAMTATMKQMETVGYLDSTMQSQLRTSLEQIGMTNISFSGSNMDDSTLYGENIKLVVSGTIKLDGGLCVINDILGVDIIPNEMVYSNKAKGGVRKS